MESDPADVAFRVFVIRVCQLAATVGALWDHIITFDSEVTYIWRKKWSPLKCLFLFNRYVGAAMLLMNAIVFMSSNVSSSFCHAYLRVQAITACALIWVVQAIMQYRLYAIYERSRVLMLTLGGLWAAEAVAMAVIVGFSHGVGAMNTPLPGLDVHICTPTNVPSSLFAFWIPIMAFESVMFVLALRKGFSHIVQFAKHGNWWCPKMLTGVLVRDSVLYFFINCAIYALTLVLWLALGEHAYELPEGFALGITCVMGARMILNLREAYHAAPATALFTTGVAWTPAPGVEPEPMWPKKGGPSPEALAAAGIEREQAEREKAGPKRKVMGGTGMRMNGGLGPRRPPGQEESMLEFAPVKGRGRGVAQERRGRGLDSLDMLDTVDIERGGGPHTGASSTIGEGSSAAGDSTHTLGDESPERTVRGEGVSPVTLVGSEGGGRPRSMKGRKAARDVFGSFGSVISGASGASLGANAARGLSFGSVAQDERAAQLQQESRATALREPWRGAARDSLRAQRDSLSDEEDGDARRKGPPGTFSF